MTRKWNVVDLQKSDSVKIAARKILQTRFQETFSYQMAILGNHDAESVHDMRVAARRLNSSLILFTSSMKKKSVKSFARTFRTLVHLLGHVREQDVFLAELRRAQESTPSSQSFEFLIARLEADRKRSLNELKKFLIRQQSIDLASSFGRFLKKTMNLMVRTARIKPKMPVSEFVPVAVVHQYDSFIRHASRVIGHPRLLADLHKMRLAGKPLRYTLETFDELYDDSYHQILMEIKSLLDGMGTVHDIDVHIPLLVNYISELKSYNSHQKLANKIPTHPVLTVIKELRAMRLAAFAKVSDTLTEWREKDFRSRLLLAVSESASVQTVEEHPV